MSPDARPLVSVVVPCYRHEAFVAAALQSVYDQDYEAIELIVIDDASPDGTVAAVADWASRQDADGRFARFELLPNPVNLGAHGSINRGCRLARGEYIAVLNSDDLFAPARIRRLVEAVQRASAHLAFSRVAPVDEQGRFVSPVDLPPQLFSVFERADRAAANLPNLAYAFRLCNIAISTGNFLFSRALYERIGPFADLKYVHDWDFALRSTLVAEPVYVPEDLYLYRLHGSNSFSQLGDIAAIETEAVYARYAACRSPGGDDFERLVSMFR